MEIDIKDIDIELLKSISRIESYCGDVDKLRAFRNILLECKEIKEFVVEKSVDFESYCKIRENIKREHND